MTRQLQDADLLIAHVEPMMARINELQDMFAGMIVVLETAKRLAESVRNPHPLSTLELTDTEKNG